MRKFLFLLLLLAIVMPTAQAQRRLLRPILQGSGDTITWSQISNVKGYQIRYRIGRGRIQRLSFTPQQLSHTFRNMRFDADYRIEVRALSLDTGVRRHSAWSNRVTLRRAKPQAVPTNTPVPPTYTPVPPTSTPIPSPTPLPRDLAAPSNLRPLNMNSVAWNAVAGAVNYNLNYRPSGEDWKNIKRVSQTSFQLKDPIPHRDYQVRVRALGDGVDYQWTGLWSDIVTLHRRPTNTPLPPPPTSTPAPRQLQAPTLRYVSDTTFAWSSVEGAIDYLVSIIGGQSAVVGSTQYTIRNAPAGASLRIQVQALGDGVNYVSFGPRSNQLSFTIPQPTDPPPPPTDPPPTDPPPPTPIPATPIQDWRTWKETKTEACGPLKNCSYVKDCSVICYRAVPGAACVDVPDEQRCDLDWTKISEEYHTTPTPAPPTKKPKKKKPNPTDTPDCRPGTQWEYREDHFRPEGKQCPVRVVKYKRLVHTGCHGWRYDEWTKTDEYTDHC